MKLGEEWASLLQCRITSYVYEAQCPVPCPGHLYPVGKLSSSLKIHMSETTFPSSAPIDLFEPIFVARVAYGSASFIKQQFPWRQWLCQVPYPAHGGYPMMNCKTAEWCVYVWPLNQAHSVAWATGGPILSSQLSLKHITFCVTYGDATSTTFMHQRTEVLRISVTLPVTQEHFLQWAQDFFCQRGKEPQQICLRHGAGGSC